MSTWPEGKSWAKSKTISAEKHRKYYNYLRYIDSRSVLKHPGKYMYKYIRNCSICEEYAFNKLKIKLDSKQKTKRRKSNEK